MIMCVLYVCAKFRGNALLIIDATLSVSRHVPDLRGKVLLTA